MIIKSVESYETGRKLYEIVAVNTDQLPFKKNGTLPKDAVTGSKLTLVDCDRTFIYFETDERGHSEKWVPITSSQTISLIAYATAGYDPTVSSPADLDAVKTAIATAYTVKRVNGSASTSDVSYGSTVGTNYQLVIPEALTAGAYEGWAVYTSSGPSKARLTLDEFNVPVNNIADYVQFKAPEIYYDDATNFAASYYAKVKYKIS